MESSRIRIVIAKAIHICNLHEPTLGQKLQKSMSCQHTVRNGNFSKFEI
jgi:hypothetical protein